MVFLKGPTVVRQTVLMLVRNGRPNRTTYGTDKKYRCRRGLLVTDTEIRLAEKILWLSTAKRALILTLLQIGLKLQSLFTFQNDKDG